MSDLASDRIDALVAVGFQHHRAGRISQAEDSYRRALVSKPKHPNALYLLGLLAHQTGRREMAVAVLREAAAVAPANAEVLNTAAAAFQAAGRPEDALAYLHRARQAAPDFVPALTGLAMVSLTLGRPREATEALEKVLSLQPRHPDALVNLGSLRLSQGEPEKAVDLYRRALKARPGFAQAAFNLGVALEKLERFDEAEAAYRKAVGINPNEATHHHNLGNLLRQCDRLEEAADCFRRAISLQPKFAPTHLLLAETLGVLDQAEEAIVAYTQAIALEPNHADAALGRGTLLMARGDFAKGLADYEERRRPSPPRSPGDFPVPDWDGRPVEGALLVRSEQGVGDHLMYAALLPLVRERIAIAAVECDPRLVPMLSRGMEGIPFVATDEFRGIAFTHYTAMASLMRRLEPWPESFEPPRRYIEPDACRKECARSWLAGLGRGPKIGISWRSAVKPRGVRKSLALDDWGAILADRDAIFIDLQYGETSAEVAAARSRFGVRIEAMPNLDRFADLDGLIALIDSLDLVITTSNVTAHFAGALGRKDWLLLQSRPLWYWSDALRPGSTLFYPSLKPYRQETAGAWSDAVGRVAADLGSWLAIRRSDISAS